MSKIISLNVKFWIEAHDLTDHWLRQKRKSTNSVYSSNVLSLRWMCNAWVCNNTLCVLCWLLYNLHTKAIYIIYFLTFEYVRDMRLFNAGFSFIFTATDLHCFFGVTFFCCSLSCSLFVLLLYVCWLCVCVCVMVKYKVA